MVDMNNVKEELMQKVILESLALQSPVGLALLDEPIYEVPRHIELLNERLLQVANGDIDRLAVFMPPRSAR